MPEAKANKLYKTFIKGLITEASPLSFPEDSSYDESNFVLNRDGSRSRRLGVDAEASHQDITSSVITESNLENGFVTQYEWQAAGGDGNNNFWVVQVYNKLLFFNLNDSSVTSGKHVTEVELDAYKIADETTGLYRCSFASGKGRLFVVNKQMDPIYIEYDDIADSFTVTSYQVLIRDTIGIDDGLAVDTRPEVLTPEHRYNLQNQGWYPGAVEVYQTEDSPIDIYATAEGKYPSNADLIYIGKLSSANNADIIGLWSAVEQVKTDLGTTAAPKGHYILNAFNKDYSVVSGVADVPSAVADTRPSAVTFYSGRVWLAGVDSADQNGTIFFSQVIQSPQNIGKFYQDADPTNEIISDLIATDGGTINIPEIGTVHKLEAVDTFVIVFASNGIWAIGNTEGFRADDFFVRKLSNVGALSPASIVVAEGSPLYWSIGGIYSIRPNQVSNDLRAENITEGTIQTFYNEQIPSASKYHITSVYDIGEKKVYWFYNSDQNYDGSSFVNKYDGVLVLDLVLQAFYKFDISELELNSPYIASAGTSSGRRRTSITNNVVDNSNNTVINADLDSVITSTFRSGSSATTIKLLVAVPGDTWSISVAEFNNTNFCDWSTWSNDGCGADYSSYLETGFDIGEDIVRAKQVAYINVACTRTEDTWQAVEDGTVDLNKQSSCLLQARWDWHTTNTGNRWSSSIQAYRQLRAYMPAGPSTAFDPGNSIVVTKNRLRGHGRALQLRFSSEQGKDLQLLGWQVAYRGRTNV